MNKEILRLRNKIVLSCCVLFALVPSVYANDFSDALVKDVYDKLTPATCLLSYSVEITDSSSGEARKRNRSSLGLIVSPEGLVMTFGHMSLEDSEPFNIRVTVGQGEEEMEYDATLLKKPDDINVCFLRINNEEKLKFSYVEFKRDASLKIGESILLLGILGESLDYNRGVIFRHVSTILEKPRKTYCIDQSSALGFVGGPVVNTKGEIVGVVGYDLASEEGGDLYIRTGSALVYQTDLFSKYIENPPSEDELPTDDEEDAWLGILIQPLEDDMAEYWGVEKKGGVIVATVLADSPADRAGLVRGDIIVSFNDVPIRARLDREVRGFTKLVRETGPGNTVPVKLLRNGDTIELEVDLVDKPKTAYEAEEYTDKIFGLTVRELTTDVRLMLNLADDVQGVIVRKVKSGSTAQQAEMRPGVIILAFAENPITNLEEFKEIVAKVASEKPAEISVFCRVGSVTGFFRLQPRWDNDE